MKKLITKLLLASYAFLILGGIGTILREMFNGNTPQF